MKTFTDTCNVSENQSSLFQPIQTPSVVHLLLYISAAFSASLGCFGETLELIDVQGPESSLFLAICVYVSAHKKVGKAGKPKLWPVSRLLQLHNPFLDPTLTLNLSSIS